MAAWAAARGRIGAVASAAVVTLAVTAGLGNQAVSGWRVGRATSGSWDGWMGVLFSPVQLTGWRFTKTHGDPSVEHWLAPLVFNAILVVGSLLLVFLTARGGGRLATAAATWGAVIVAAGLASVAYTPMTAYDLGGSAARAYDLVVPYGLTLGFILGFISGVLALIFGGEGAAASNGAEPVPDELQNTATLPMPGMSWPITEE